MGNFNLVERDNHERRLCKLNKGIRSRLDKNIGAIRHTRETNFAERNINIDALVLARIRDLLGESLELAVQGRPSASFFLLGLEFLLVAVAVLAAAVARLVELHLGGFAVELDVARLPLSDHDWCLEVHVDYDDQFVVTRLEEEMLDVAEEHVDVLVAEG
jgi:hypothetical protein